MIGSVLSADVVARYYRLKGDEVVFVSGSDEHGTPIEVEAVRLGIPPKQLTDKNHEIVSKLFKEWNISFDNYTRTESPTHKEFVQKHFLKIYENGYIYRQETELLFCPTCNRFLPDRFVEGKCPFCAAEKARGDQCDNCGRLLEPTSLIEPYCVICKTRPQVKRTLHWYFDMSKFTEKLYQYIKSNKRLPDNARNFSLNLLQEGLRARAITRDNKWGIPAPFPGAEDKTIYVWVEAVLGYISATIEYFREIGKEEKWKEYWLDKEAKTIYFIGKDNIPFHTLILPALLLASGENYNLPWNVSSTEFLLFKEKRFSKSHRVGIWIDEALKLFPADYWRFFLLSIRPETKDANFTWEIFKEKVNSELNDTLGNFIHRTLTFISQYYDDIVPKPKTLDKEDKTVLKLLRKRIEKLSQNLEQQKLQAATRQVISISRLGNKYLNKREPWNLLKTNPEKAANTLYIAIQIVKALAITLDPFIPTSAGKLRKILNLSDKELKWEEALTQLPSGHKINKAEPLFIKINVTEEVLQEMLEKARSKSEKIAFEDFSKIDLRIGKIEKAEAIPQSRNLIKLIIDIGETEKKQAIAGIATQYEAKQLEGKYVAVVTNLQPKKVFGVESQVMILAAEDENIISILVPDRPVKAGSKIR
jgi:methionyl-tRNA synthetase